MNSDLIILVFSAVCVPIFAVRFVLLSEKPDEASVVGTFKLLFVSLAFAVLIVALPLCVINRFVLSKTFWYVDAGYRAAKEMEAKTDPGLNIEWPLEPPVPVFWPFPVISHIESGEHLYAKQQVKICFKTTASKHPGYVILSSLVLIILYSPVLAFIYNLRP